MMAADFSNLARIQCPACGYVFSGHDRPRAMSKLLYPVVTCPQCDSQLRPNRQARTATAILIAVAAVLAGMFFLYTSSRDTQAILVAALGLALGIYLLIVRMQRWEVVATGASGRGAIHTATKRPEVNAAAARTLSRPAFNNDFVHRFGIKGMTKGERYSLVALAVATGALFASFALKASDPPSMTFFAGIALLMMVIGLVLLVRQAPPANLEIDRHGIRSMHRNVVQVIAWSDVQRVTESFMARRVTVCGRRGQRITLSYRIGNFQLLRDLLIEHLGNHLVPRKIYARLPLGFILLLTMATLLAGMVAAALWKVHSLILPALLVVLPVALGFYVLAFRQVLSVALSDAGVQIRRYIGTPKSIAYGQIRDLLLEENLDALLAMRAPSSNNQSPGVVIITHDGSSCVVNMLVDGPMGLYLAIMKEWSRHKRE